MVQKSVSVGSMTNIHVYEGDDFTGGVVTDDVIIAGTAPTNPNEVLRLGDVGGILGDVVGPGASTDNAIARFHGATGKILQNSGVLVDDSGNIVLSDDTWLGIGGALERIIFDADNNQIEIMGASVGIATLTPAAVLDVVGNVRLGDSATNYFGSASDGEVSLHGTARVKLEVVQQAFSSKKGAASPTEVLSQVGTTATMLEPRLSFSAVVQQDIHFIIHVPENADGSVNVQFHLMWIPASGWTAGNYMWKLEYIVKDENADSTTVASTTISADVTPANDDNFIETEFATTIDAGPDQTISCHLYRDVANDNGDAAGEVRFVEVEYTANKLGEAT